MITTQLEWYRTSEKTPPLDTACLVCVDYCRRQYVWIAHWRNLWEGVANGENIIKPSWHSVHNPTADITMNGQDSYWCLMPNGITQ